MFHRVNDVHLQWSILILPAHFAYLPYVPLLEFSEEQPGNRNPVTARWFAGAANSGCRFRPRQPSRRDFLTALARSLELLRHGRRPGNLKVTVLNDVAATVARNSPAATVGVTSHRD